MRTSFKNGDRCRVGRETGTILSANELMGSYTVRLDDGRTVNIDERILLAAKEPGIPIVKDKAIRGPREPAP